MTIEDKEWRGASTKLLIWLIGHTAIIVATAVGFYFQIKSDIRDASTKQSGKYEYYEEKFKSLQLQNSILTKQLEGIEIQVSDLRRELMEHK